METGQLLELQGEAGGEEKERRAIQKERDRERRRLRDRQRRKSMSLEEREIHLARRRKNYQIRRQRAAAANAKLGISHQSSVAESSVRIDCEMQFATDYVNNQPHKNPSVHHLLLNHGETDLPRRYRYPGSFRLTQIKQIIRLLNICPEKPCLEITVPNGIPRKGIRLVHLKNLIRMMNSKITTEQNNSDNNIKEEEEEEERSCMQNEWSDDRRRVLLWNKKAIDAIDENEQICADGKCIL